MNYEELATAITEAFSQDTEEGRQRRWELLHGLTSDDLHKLAQIHEERANKVLRGEA